MLQIQLLALSLSLLVRGVLNRIQFCRGLCSSFYSFMQWKVLSSSFINRKSLVRPDLSFMFEAALILNWDSRCFEKSSNRSARLAVMAVEYDVPDFYLPLGACISLLRMAIFSFVGPPVGFIFREFFTLA